MRTLILILLTAFLCESNLFAQPEMELSEEEFNELSAFAYEMCKSIFTEKDYVFKEAAFEESDFFEPIVPSKAIDQLIAHIKKTGKLLIEDEGFGPQLNLALSFTEDMSNAFDVMDKLELESMNIKDTQNKALELGGYFTTSRSNEEYKFKAGLDKDSYTVGSTLQGEATYTFELKVGYEQIELTQKDIGKTFTLNNCEIKFVDIIGTQIILEPTCAENFPIKLINYAGPNLVYEPYAYDELMKMQEEDPNINTEGSFTQSSQTIDKKMYRTFKEDPNFTLKQFRKLLSQEEIIRLAQQADVYLILEHVAPIGDRFILFSPRIRKEKITVKY